MLKYAFIYPILRNVFRLVWRLLTDSRVPLLTKAIVPVTLIYIVSPFDIIVDFIPILGQIDDIASLIIGVSLFLIFSPSNIVFEHLENLTHRKFSKPQNKDTIIEGTSNIIEEDEGKNWK